MTLNYLGVYHSEYPKSAAGICDAPCISKGRMMICAHDSASEGNLLALLYGRMRNKRQLTGALGLQGNASGAAIVLGAYKKWGRDYPCHIEGPVVTCVMDASKDMLVLSRDRMGEQLLYYAAEPDGKLVFSDHPDSLLKTDSAKSVINADGLCELFGLGPAHTPGKTALRDIRMLKPGCILVGEDGVLSVRTYFSLKHETHRESRDETIRHTRFLLEQALDSLPSGRASVMLSGGLDSTALTALMRRRYDNIQSFSVDYSDSASDFRPNAFRPERDIPYIELAAEAFGTQHRTFVLEQAALADALENAVSARGLPGMADIDSSLLLFAGEIAPHARWIVSGECGDEVFGGYPWFRQPPQPTDTFPWSGPQALRESILRKEISARINLREYVGCAYRDALERTGFADTEDPEHRLRQMQLLCFEFFMPNLQERAARMCGYHALEVVTPLCDDRLVQYVFNVPWTMKFMGGQEKGLFRAAVSDCMPPVLNARKKSPYPKTCSPIYTEIIRGLTMAMLSDRHAPILELIDRERVRKIAESPLDPAETPWFGQLMSGPQMLAYLWQVNTWMRDRNITVSL